MIEVVWVDDECLDDSGHLTHLGESICDAAYRRGININAFRDYVSKTSTSWASPVRVASASPVRVSLPLL